MKRQTVVAIAGVGLLLAFAAATQLYSSREADRIESLVTAEDSPLERPHSQSKGPADAKVVLVEFFDPACETCRAFDPYVKTLLAEHPTRVRLVLRYAPFHQGSDTMVKILEAAALQALLGDPPADVRHTAAMGEPPQPPAREDVGVPAPSRRRRRAGAP